VKLSGTIHFIGISGIGMSALARILLQRGFAVSGSSDRRTALTARLAEEGAEIFIGHDARNLGDAKTVVVSSAIDPANAELAAARAASLQVMYRGALLAQLMQGRRAIAIAGTHGKTTTTAMTACVLEASGLDPTVVVGGERVDTRSNAHDGRGEWFVAESDESDRSFLEMHPEIAIVTNVENDHVASDGEFAGLIVAFEKFLAGVPASGLALVGIDEPRAAALARMPRSARTRTFGFAESDVCAPGVTFASFGSRFDVIVDGKRAGEIRLPVPGAYNVQNALAAIAAGLAVGVPFETLAAALGAFRGVRRRFEILARSPRMTLVDDYAHHPTAVAAVLRAAREQFAGPIVAVFQPHRYSRTQYLAAEFASALRSADRVVLTDVYAASEAPMADVDAHTIGRPLVALGGEVAYVARVEDLPEYLLQHAPAGALVLMLGAGSITGAAERLAAELESAEALVP
jgi:UDP-N-acetylmuramate--alanine ligase